MPNPIQVQLRTFFWDYDNGWAFPCYLLEKGPRIGTTEFPMNDKAPVFIGYVYPLTWTIWLQQRMHVTGKALRDRLSRFDYHPLNKSGLGPVQKHLDNSDPHRSNFGRFEHDYIRLLYVSPAPPSLHKQTNENPVSTTRYDPIQARGPSTPKQIHIQHKDNRHAEPGRCAYRNDQVNGKGDQQAECTCDASQSQRRPNPASQRSRRGDAVSHFR
jgi:hypothetical protein